MLWKALVFAALFSTSAALAAPTVECRNADPSSAELYDITATIASDTELDQITFVGSYLGQTATSHYDAIPAISDPSDMSMQDGQRFYFHAGNTSHFLLIADGLLKAAVQSPPPFAFNAQNIYEQYERGGSQDIVDLVCITK